ANFIYGTDPRTGKYYICAEGDAGGYGGKPYEDGEHAFFSMDLGDTYNVPVEVAEVRYPWRVERFELHQDSGGPGKFRGGLGVIRDYRIIGHDAGLTVTTDRVKYTPPWGLFGGRDAKTNITVVYRNDDEPLDDRVWVMLAISVEDEEMTIDFTGTGAQCRGPMNVPKPTSISSARYGFKIITTPDLPSNEGFFRPLKIVIPESSLLNPKFPAACAMWPAPTTTIPDLILKALAPAIPDRVRAGHFGDSMANFIYGTDPRTGKYYICAERRCGRL
ncbi:unnamed protein product, partial [marine sediment metagenome]